MSPNANTWPDSVLPEHVRTVRRFNRLYELAIHQADEVLRRSGFSRLDLRVFRELGSSPYGANALWLRWRLGVEKAFVSRLFRSLRLHGYIEWEPSALDRRVRNVRLTTLGWVVHRSLESRCDEGVRRLLERLCPADRQSLVEAMETIERVLSLDSPLQYGGR